MKVGLQINRFSWPGGKKTIGDTLQKIATTADQQGFYSIWVMDHFFQIGHIGPAEDPMLEAYTTLGFLAGITQQAKLGTMVTGVIYRYPGLLIKAVTTLDVLSRGRAYLGIGAAWNEEESHALGFDFPPLKDRFEQLEETLQIAHKMFSGDTSPFTGKKFHLENPMNNPMPVSHPHPPILIGGSGEQKTLRLVAEYGDACNLFAQMGEDALKHKLNVLKKHCQAVGRNYNEIEKTALFQVHPENGGIDTDEVIKVSRQLNRLGFDQIIFGIRNVDEITPLHVFGEKIIPELSSMTNAS